MAPTAIDNNDSPKGKPIFMATHPRACSTAFERVMMTRTDVLTCVHEPFGEPFYYSHAERLGGRYGAETEEAWKAREQSGHSQMTYRDVFDAMQKQAVETGKRIFIKDIAHYLIPPTSYKKPTKIAASLTNQSSAKDDAGNPTVAPLSMLRDFHFTFLIRHPRRAIPSYYRCTQPPLSEMTGFHYFMAEEAGYRELRALFDYLRSSGSLKEDVFVLDADDLLEKPEEAIEAYCKNVGIEYTPAMLSWEKGEGCEAFAKWKGFHEDAISSGGLKKREKRKEKTQEEEFAEWEKKWGREAAELIRKTVKETTPDYEYLARFKRSF